MKKKIQTIRYRGKLIRLGTKPIRKGICECCGRKGLTNLHHWRYAYKVKEVRKNPELALKNVTELCFVHHKLADCIRTVGDADQKVVKKLKKLRSRGLT